ncbi:O-succinylbenzoate-CoA ligase [Knoellia sinensis KCTC 19936]|uniref:O-succinylbenzoate-CoA ligase n=1 Tax=Knoellia sinensis KCTC 19936 TaxID=1385520 RepID=A0A0A0JCC4_9MICO|nr:class I adenylate-forming enzyme family protein [Knoellia sinensis]KGN33296.1 O-succinylbenzoate-CoA ligase [Knoellia sinensis KCTC 19936]
MRETAALRVLRDMGVLREAEGRSWLELTTSGTTAAPRTVRRTVASWVDSFDHVSRLTGTGPGDRVLVPSPPSSSMFAFAHAHAAHVGAGVVALNHWSLRNAERALRTCTVAHFTPGMLAGMLERDPGSLRTAVCAGAVLPDAVREGAAAAGIQVVDYYGAAELSFVAMRSSGRMEPFPEVEIDLRDGAVWARSPWLADGYSPGQSGPLLWDADGFASVGDHGRMDDDLGLVVLGRGSDTITTGGATVLCADIEAVLRSLPSVSDAAVVGMPHTQLGEVVEAVLVRSHGPDVDRAVDHDLDAVRADTAGLVARTHLPRRWHEWPELPLTTAGKVDRAAIRARLSADRRTGDSP